MRNNTFQTPQQPGIYHTLSLWRGLSPRLAKSEKGKPATSYAKSDHPENESTDVKEENLSWSDFGPGD